MFRYDMIVFMFSFGSDYMMVQYRHAKKHHDGTVLSRKQDHDSTVPCLKKHHGGTVGKQTVTFEADF